MNTTQTIDLSTIRWPAVIKYDGDAELAFVADQAEWETDVDLHRFAHRESDALIDSDGKMFALSRLPGRHTLEAKGISITLDELIALIRAHASQAGSCCVTKFSAGSVAEAIQSIKDLT